MESKIETIVIEDNPQFLEIAKQAYAGIEGLNPAYFATYEPAIEYIQTNKDKIERVVSDMFFPSQKDWKHEIYNEFKDRIDEYVQYALKDFKGLTENPSGIAIARYCAINSVPFILISQGDRHKDNLKLVRPLLKYFKELKCIATPKHDPIHSIAVYNGCEIDKSNPKTWLDALDGSPKDSDLSYFQEPKGINRFNEQYQIKSLLHLAKRL
ncbi:MAG: hypothetical protein ACOYT4_03850 [Nanoarchaeota archaeon]